MFSKNSYKNKFPLFLFFLFGTMVGIHAQTYCAATSTDCNFEVITNVNLANINNTSGCGLPYDDYSALQATIAPGTTVTGSITKSDILANYIAVVFVDWNNNGIFDPTEQITTNSQGASTFLFNITAPIGTLNGLKRMRVRLGQNTLPAACGVLARGDTEDYTINLTTAPFPAPVNNTCASAVVLTPTSTCSNTGGTTLGATSSFGPNTCGTGASATDVWYTFTANGTSQYEVRATGNGAGSNLFDPIIELFSGCAQANYISCANATALNMTEVISTGVLPAGVYYYRVYGNGNAGNFTTCVVDITPQPGDDCSTPLNLTNLNNNCSVAERYNNFGAITSSFGPATCWANTSKDVWFQFTATAPSVRIDVFGLGSSTNTLQQPQLALYSGVCAGVLLGEGCATTTPGTNNSFLSIGGLAVGTTYLVRVDSQNGHEGTFQFCINNFTPAVTPGQDCGTARVLCTKDPIVETDITGYGADGFEAANSCLAAGVSAGAVTEQNSTWYTWTAANNGVVGFDIIPGPTNPNIDIDFVLYQFDPASGCVGRTMIRCMGSSCVGPTGLNATSIDLTEPFDCDPTIQDNYVQSLTQMAGTRYGLLVNNFQNGGSGYTINFNGNGTFLGPQPAFTTVAANPCVVPQTVTITDNSVDVDTYLWNFGAGANPATANTAGPHNVTYGTAGDKIITLTVTGAGGCDSTIQKTYVVAAPLSATTSIINSRCDLPNGEIQVNKSGGNGMPNQFMYSLNGGTPQNSPVFSNLNAGAYTVNVVDSLNCSITLNVTVGGTPTPNIDPIAPVFSCGNYILQGITGTNLTGNESYFSQPNGGGLNYDPGQTISSDVVLYAFDQTTTVPACSDEESFSITINNSPSFQNLTKTCGGTNVDYTVSFEVTGGDPATYMVNVVSPAGVTGGFVGNIWTSSGIASGVSFVFEITDGNNCPPTQVTGNKNCNCVTDPGTMGSSTIVLCGNGVINANHTPNSYTSDGNDTLQFVLHDLSQNNLGTVYGISYIPSFAFAAGMTYGTTYYISAIAGDNNGLNQVDQNDPCFGVAPGQPVQWRQVPTADFSGSTAICNGQSTNLTFTLTGVSPFNVVYNNGTSNTAVSGIADQGIRIVSPTVTRNYTLISVNSANGCIGTVSPTIVTVTVNNPPTITGPNYMCNATNDGYTVSFTVNDGNGGPYTVTPTAPAGVTFTNNGNTYTSSEIPSGTAFNFNVDDANTCGPVVVSGTHNCVCSSSAGLMAQPLISACDNEMVTAMHNQSSMVLDNNDVLT